MNIHPDLLSEQVETLLQTKKELTNFMEKILDRFRQDVITDLEFEQFKSARQELIQHIERGISDQISLATERKLSGKNSDLILTILLSNKNIVVYCSRLVKIFYKVKSEDTNDMLDKLMED